MNDTLNELEQMQDRQAEGGWTDPMADPSASNAAINSVLAIPADPMPQITLPCTDGHVDLPGGLITEEGIVVRTAAVRELTGEHEERIAKARLGKGGAARMLSTLLECGVERVGDQPSSPELLRKLLVGDRAQLILEIRRITYGNEIEFPGARCPHCDGEVDITVTLDDIPTSRLDDPSERTFPVPLRRGRTAQVRLPIGADHEALLEAGKLSAAEENTLLLSRVVLSFTEPDGTETAAAGRPVMVRDQLSIPDRAAILKALGAHRPGPRYDELTFVHEQCGEEVQLPITEADLFQGL